MIAPRHLLPLIVSLVACSQSERVASPDPLRCRPQEEPLVASDALGGAGAAEGLVEALNRGRRLRGRPQLTYLKGFGSAAGLRALQDGRLGVAIIARELTQQERDAGLVAAPLVKTPVAFFTARQRPKGKLHPASLRRLYTKTGLTWPDGEPVTLLFREPSDGTLLAIAQADPALGAALSQDPRPNNLGLLLTTDADTRDALLSVPGAIGFLDLATPRSLHLSLTPLDLSGVAPSPATLRDGSYPFGLTLRAVRRGDDTRAAQLIASILDDLSSVELEPLGYLHATP